MPVHWTILSLLALAALGFALARARALRAVGGDARRLHSRPGHHGWNAAIWTFLPAFAGLLVWVAVQPPILDRLTPRTSAALGPAADLRPATGLPDPRQLAAKIDDLLAGGALAPADLRRGAGIPPAALRRMLAGAGAGIGPDLPGAALAAALAYRGMAATAVAARTVLVGLLALGGLALALARSNGAFRARNAVEATVSGLLILASGIAIATTAGIVASLLYESRSFFALYDWKAFFLSASWSPRFQGGSDLGILPLLWGTLYISVIALAVAVPVGLLAAIYMSEYSGRRFRAVVKPLIEILAGIPTIVYGLFALLTVGPLLRDWFARPMGLGGSASSVMTAGLVMGIMLIPFISSLSDDIIGQVPQSLRDGALGLGATPSETIRQVVLPAALPGIVGAILLAASRAVGETMIVVLGAGAAARLSLDPFEAMTTITVKIASQLTGDSDFASPETLVAFALGLTLFVLTLGLNVLALHVVRRYREHYE